jgi:hypothetical protein
VLCYLLRLRRSELQEEIRVLQDTYREPCTPSFASDPLAESPTPQFDDRFFCSQLISSIFAEMGLTSPQRDQHTHVPSEFSSSAASSGIHLLPPFRFSPDISFQSRGCLHSLPLSYVPPPEQR